ncbi:MAG: 50S ribosomal protein L9 [Candidatus Obscuribacterales bacterium]|nr:50S ribosomal protein L9 [Candidatus Obscuribacterales bacterium]
MKVILQKNVQKLGKMGDVVEAKPGYYRNFLQPRGLAQVATDGAMKKRDEELEALKAKAEKLHQEAVVLGEKISALGSIKLLSKAGDAGRLYGKVTNKDIADELSKTLGFDIDKRGVKTLEEISALGTYKAYVKVTTEVTAEVNVEVAQAG